LVKVINRINKFIGESTSWLTTALVFLVCFDVFRRYLLKDSSAWIMELQWHIFSIIFLFASGYTLQINKHVRVDLFYEKFTIKQRAWINLLGCLLFLIPWCLVLIYFSTLYAYNSWIIGETSPDPGGLPARYIIKFCVPIGLCFLMMQGISISIQSINTIRKS